MMTNILRNWEPKHVYENCCVFVIAQSYQEKRAVITTNDDDNVCRHQPITIFDFFLTFIFGYINSNLVHKM